VQLRRAEATVLAAQKRLRVVVGGEPQAEAALAEGQEGGLVRTGWPFCDVHSPVRVSYEGGGGAYRRP
jgi:hypothetical protein